MDAKFIFAKQLVREAGRFLLGKMAEQRQVAFKSSRTDLVTDLDRTVQEFLIKAIQTAYPASHFFAEESSQQADLNVGQVWVIDPIDGTVNFFTQQADFAIMLAYLEDGIGRFGIIYDVMADKLYAGGADLSLTCNELPLPAPQTRSLSQSLLACNTGLYLTNDHGIRDFADQALGVRNYGCAGLSMIKVMTGQLYAYASQLYPWDYLPAQIIGESLGFVLVDLSGQTIHRDGREKVIFFSQAALAEFPKNGTH